MAQVSLVERIVSICDVFDALTNERSYKSAWLIDEAINEIKGKSGKYFDSPVVITILPKIQVIDYARVL